MNRARKDPVQQSRFGAGFSRFRSEKVEEKRDEHNTHVGEVRGQGCALDRSRAAKSEEEEETRSALRFSVLTSRASYPPGSVRGADQREYSKWRQFKVNREAREVRNRWRARTRHSTPAGEETTSGRSRCAGALRLRWAGRSARSNIRRIPGAAPR